MAKKARKVNKKTRKSKADASVRTTPANNKRKNEDASSSASASKKLKESNSNTTLLNDTPSSSDRYLPSIRAPQHKMEDLVGLDDIKKRITRSIINPFVMNEDSAKYLGVRKPKGLLLKGPPGCGKTALADAIVNSLRENLKNVAYYTETGSCLSQWFGESERNLRTLFATAHANSPAVIFLDEIDGIGSTRENPNCGGGNTRLTTLLNEINNVKRGQVLVIGATNLDTHVDAALVRTGRFNVSLEVTLPDDQDREKILLHYLQNTKMRVDAGDLERIVERTANWSGAKLEELVDQLYLARLERACPKYSTLSRSRLDSLLKRPLAIDMDRDVVPLLVEMETLN